jgi:NADH dehydrogenase/NADH:ubiquinone oxidoreductase subunit G
MPEETIKVIIDGYEVSVPTGTTILEAAEQMGIEIPLLCYYAHTTANGLCRLCVVEVEGSQVLQAACVTVTQDGAVIKTNSPKVKRARRTILEMLASTVNLSESPAVLQMLVDYHARPERFAEGKKRQPDLIDDNPVYLRDYAQCIMCWRCVQVCADDAQYTYALNFGGRGFESRITTYFEKPMPDTTCVFCGQCVGVCPTGALKAKREHLLELGVTPDEVFEVTRIGAQGQHSRRGPHLDREDGNGTPTT